jgi:hypothetical protein
VALRPLLGGTPPSAATALAVLAALEQPDRELELLCMRPLLLHGAFSVVRRVKDRLRAIMGTMRSGTLATAGPWGGGRELEDDFALAYSTIFATVQRLLEEARRIS